MGSTPNTYSGSQSLFGRCIWILGHRPYLWFHAIWLGLLGAFIAVQLLFGIAWAEVGSEPPAPESIDYRKYLPSDRNWLAIPLSMPEDVLPPYQRPSRSQAGQPWRSSLQIAGEYENDALLLVAEHRWHRDVGWPGTLGALAGQAAYDVTDPRLPFRRRAGHWDYQFGRTNDGTAIWYSTDRSRSWRVEPNARPLVYWLAGFLVFATLVGTVGSLVRFRSNRRWRCGRCVICNHQLGPTPQPERCFECGYGVPASLPMRCQRLIGRRPIVVFLWCWLLCVISGALFMAANGFDHPMQWRAFEAYAGTRERLLEDQAEPRPQSYELARRDFGWPFAAVIREQHQWYITTFDGGPIPGPSPGDLTMYYQGTSKPPGIVMIRPVEGQLGRVIVYRVQPWMFALYGLLLTIPVAILILVGSSVSGVIVRSRGRADPMPSTDRAAERSESSYRSSSSG